MSVSRHHFRIKKGSREFTFHTTAISRQAAQQSCAKMIDAKPEELEWIFTEPLVKSFTATAYLFGVDACKVYETDGYERLYKLIQEGKIGFRTYLFEPQLEDEPTQLLRAFTGETAFTEILTGEYWRLTALAEMETKTQPTQP